MSNKGPIYNNAQSIARLGEAFQQLAEGQIQIPQRKNNDLAQFLERVNKAREATRKNSVKFG